MNTIETNHSISKEEYNALLLIYASHTDLDFSETEKAQIVQKVGMSVFDSAEKLFSQFREYELLKKICDYRHLYYPGDGGKNEILRLIKLHFEADGEYSKLEKTQFDFLRMML